MSKSYLFTSESVSEGHPDKIADQISDGVLDAVLTQDPQGRVACETLVNTGLVVLSGEITTTAIVDFTDVARATIRRIGYNARMGFDGDTCAVVVAMDKQSPDIAQGVNEGQGLDLEQGAGDQGLMFGYATNETETLMPMPITFAHTLMQRQAAVRRSGRLPWLRPDAKSQVTIRYENDVPAAIDTIVVSTQHDPEVRYEDLKEAVMEEIIKPALPEGWLTKDTRYFINPTGRFVIGGPVGDCGLTGRKIIVDTYGGAGRHGGGAFSGKDPTKVDRSACYMARYVAKNIVGAGLAKRCEVQIAYAIGVADPVSVHVNTYQTSPVSDRLIETVVRELFPLTPKGIIDHLKLRRPIYRKTASYGHFGRTEEDFTWEKLDMAESLRRETERLA